MAQAMKAKALHMSEVKEVPKSQMAKGKQNVKVRHFTKGPGEFQQLALASQCSSVSRVNCSC